MEEVRALLGIDRLPEEIRPSIQRPGSANLEPTPGQAFCNEMSQEAQGPMGEGARQSVGGINPRSNITTGSGLSLIHI